MVGGTRSAPAIASSASAISSACGSPWSAPRSFAPKAIAAHAPCSSADPNGDRFDYRPVDSCIQWMFQLDGAHVVTIEGLSRDDRLTPVQEAMVECHGSQCGFCTPGFVVAMTGLLEQRSKLADDDWRHGLTGNLCRCTGYVSIVDAGRSIDAEAVQRVNEIYPPSAILKDLAAASADSIAIESTEGKRTRRLFRPDFTRQGARNPARSSASKDCRRRDRRRRAAQQGSDRSRYVSRFESRRGAKWRGRRIQRRGRRFNCRRPSHLDRD